MQTTNGGDPPLYQDVFGETLLELAKANPQIVGITPAMLSGCSMNIMQREMPERVFDVGIAEQHAVTYAAGLASMGMVPFCNIYSSFAQRAYDQIIHDVAIQKLNVVLCLDRGGIVGADGATHHGVFDLAFLRCVPNLIIAAPLNEHDLRNLMYTAQKEKPGPIVIRYPRGRGVLTNWRNTFETVEIGKGRVLAKGNEIAVVSIGHAGNFAQTAIEQLQKEGIEVALYDFIFLKPFDTELMHHVFKTHKYIVTLEDGVIKGGLASEVAEFKTQFNYEASIQNLGVPDQFIEHGTPDELYAECGYNADSIYQTLKSLAETNSK